MTGIGCESCGNPIGGTHHPDCIYEGPVIPAGGVMDLIAAEPTILKDATDEDLKRPTGMLVGEAGGAIPNGRHVIKVAVEPGDSHGTGAEGVVLSSVVIPDDLKSIARGSDYFYFVEWLSHPGVPVGVMGYKLEEKS